MPRLKTHRYEKRRNAFVQAAEKIGWHAYVPKGTFYAWMPVPKGFTSETFADLLLDKAGVAVAPGNGFGEHGEGYVRIGLLIGSSAWLKPLSESRSCICLISQPSTFKSIS